MGRAQRIVPCPSLFSKSTYTTNYSLILTTKILSKMKKILLLAALALGALAVSAQSVGGGRSSGDTEVSKGWNTIYAEWNPVAFHTSMKGYDDVNVNAFSVGFNHAFGLSSSLPLYLETGVAGQYTFKGYDDYEETDGIKVFSFKVPVNLIYDWVIPNSTVELMPSVGLSLRGNVWGEGNDGDDNWNLFSKDDMYNPYKRVQLGWQIGLRVRFGGAFIIGGSYGADFMEISKKYKLRTGTIMLGYTF